MNNAEIKLYILTPNDKTLYKEVVVWADDEKNARDAANIAFPDNFKRNYPHETKTKQNHPPHDIYYSDTSKVKCRELTQEEFCIKGMLSNTVKVSIGDRTLILGKNRGECIE